MNKNRLLFLLFVLFLSPVFFTPTSYAQLNNSIDESEILIKFKDSKIDLDSLNTNTFFGQIGAYFTQKKIDSIIDPKNIESKESVYENNLYYIKFPSNVDSKKIIEELKKDSNIEYVQPNYKYETYADTQTLNINTNDPNINDQWALKNYGQMVEGVSGISGVDVGASTAWNITQGNGQIVAVIDSGVDYNHPDLVNSMWDGSSCKDENGQALGGCLHGYNFDHYNNNPMPTDSDHGTHVAGIIAAQKNNNAGISGLAPQAKIMAVKTSLYTLDNIRAINFAKHNGAKVINASWGRTASCSGADDPALRSAIASFPGIFIAAAGNDAAVHNGLDIVSTPSDLGHNTTCWTGIDNIISVAASNNQEILGSFSDYSSAYVDVAAPGVSIYSTVADVNTTTNVFTDNYTTGIDPLDWTASAGNDWLGAYSDLYTNSTSTYQNDIDQTLTLKNIDMTLGSATSAEISLTAACDTEYTPSSWSDYMTLEISKDNGTSFVELARWDEAHFDKNSIDDIPPSFAIKRNIPSDYLNNNFKTRLRFITNSSTVKTGCAVFGFKINKFTVGTIEKYQFKDGTSMAAPYVSGLAALLLSNNTNLDNSQLKSLIMNTGISTAEYVNKTVSGRRINAYSALLYSNTTISGLSDDLNSTPSKTWNWTSTNNDDQYRFAIDQSPTWTPTGTYSSTKTASQSSGNGTYYLHVQAKNTYGIESSVVTVSAVLNQNPQFYQPTISPTGGYYNSSQSITVTSSPLATHTYFTIDGTEPSGIGSSEYSTPVSIDGADNTSIIFKAISVNSVGDTSQVTSQTYDFDKSAPSVPADSAFTPNLGTGTTLNAYFAQITTISGTVEANSKIEIVVDTVGTGITAVADGSGNFVLSNNQLYTAQITGGNDYNTPKLLTLKIIDRAGNSVTTTSNISFTKTTQTQYAFGDNVTSIATENFIYPANSNNTSALNITTANPINIIIIGAGSSSAITIPHSTIISSVNIGESFSPSNLTGTTIPSSLIQNTGNPVIAAIQWGIPGVGLQFNQSITLSAYVGNEYNGQTFSVLRSLSLNSGWTTDGLSGGTTCTVYNGICQFQTQKASYFSINSMPVPTPTPTSTPQNNNSGNSSPGPQEHKAPVCDAPAPTKIPTITKITRRGNSVTVYFKPPTDQTITKYTIFYGYKKDDRRWGVTFGNNSKLKEQKFTINYLNYRNKYYFSINAGYNCADGAFSPWKATSNGRIIKVK